MNLYQAIVKNAETKKKVVVIMNYTSKNHFAQDLKGNGYVVGNITKNITKLEVIETRQLKDRKVFTIKSDNATYYLSNKIILDSYGKEIICDKMYEYISSEVFEDLTKEFNAKNIVEDEYKIFFNSLSRDVNGHCIFNITLYNKDMKNITKKILSTFFKRKLNTNDTLNIKEYKHMIITRIVESLNCKLKVIENMSIFEKKLNKYIYFEGYKLEYNYKTSKHILKACLVKDSNILEINYLNQKISKYN